MSSPAALLTCFSAGGPEAVPRRPSRRDERMVEGRGVRVEGGHGPGGGTDDDRESRVGEPPVCVRVTSHARGVEGTTDNGISPVDGSATTPQGVAGAPPEPAVVLPIASARTTTSAARPRMLQTMATQFRFTQPPSPKSATGKVADVHEQIAVDFGIHGPATFVVLSSAPGLLAPAWALMRESLIAGVGSRTGKELAALGVSLANRCPFCVDAHTVLLHATGDHALAERLARGEDPRSDEHTRVLDWGLTTRTPGADLRPYPFPDEHAPAYLGTALAFHFINRIASALLSEQLLPGGVQRFRAVRSLAGRALGRTVRRGAEPGASLPLLDTLGPGPRWATGTPVGPAYAALREAALAGAELLDPGDRVLVGHTLREWDGTHPSAVLRGFPNRRERPGARLALLAALAPYRITVEDVAAWHMPWHNDEQLVRLVAYGAFAAVDRIESALALEAPAREPQ
jgi:AhpD family alkylhydroperoxidase